jgi:hypothetical protein
MKSGCLKGFVSLKVHNEYEETKTNFMRIRSSPGILCARCVKYSDF